MFVVIVVHLTGQRLEEKGARGTNMEQQLMLKRGLIYQTAQQRHRINIYNMPANDT